MERLVQHKTAIADWAMIAGLLGVGGMNIFQIVQGVLGILLTILAIIFGYWRIRATKAKAKAYEAELKE